MCELLSLSVLLLEALPVLQRRSDRPVDEQPDRQSPEKEPDEEPDEEDQKHYCLRIVMSTTGCKFDP